ncbi:VOC family protein [Kribbella sp.]|nr:VOC family protein [Kribbella sp.]HZX02426.1 VOC family protein [Kribbella sp.]
MRTTATTLQSAGATLVQEVHTDNTLDHLWMQDPEGNDFCVV